MPCVPGAMTPRDERMTCPFISPIILHSPLSLPGEPRKMPVSHASQALSRFTVLDLTRVRSGPTCVRQLADWGANVVKIDALLEDAGGEQPGGPRQGSDFQNLHRNKRAMTLNLKDPKGLEVFRRLVE